MERDPGKNSEREASMGTGGLAGIFQFLSQAYSAGARTVVICPGGRNAPFIQALGLVAKAWDLQVLSFFEERSAAFFAIGLAKRDARPVIVSVTSGTAAAELLPAVIEAHATDIPLIIATADRPRIHRGSGSPQSMWQKGLFTQYAPTLVDWEEGEKFPSFVADWNKRSPIHVNLCHQEPLWTKEPVPEPTAPQAKSAKVELPTVNAPFPQFKKPLVLIGALPPEERQAVVEFCRWYGAPVLAEASSGVREVSTDNWLRAGERIVRPAFKRGDFDGVIRFGAVPSWRLWRDLENWSGDVQTFGPSAWSGLPRRPLQQGQLKAWLQSWRQVGPFTNARPELMEQDRALANKTQKLIQEYPHSEPALIHQLSLQAKASSLMYLGNSRPVRDWNEFASHDRSFEVQENRGLNGIDGQVSSFLGHCRPEQENWALLGDLTTMYDLAGLWALRHLPTSAQMRLVVMNNQGGRIFERLFPDQAFINQHSIEFSHWAKMWNCAYAHDFETLPQQVIIELKPSAEETRAFRDQAECL